jgi:plastocyanin
MRPKGLGLLAVGAGFAALAACAGGGADSAPTSTSATPTTLATTTVPVTTAAPTTPPVPTTAAPATPRAGATRHPLRYGPIRIDPGQNAIEVSGPQVPKPPGDGWIVRIAPNLVRADGSVPPVNVLHLHHAVWLNASRPDLTAAPIPERFFAAGEEKTITSLPEGFGYRYAATDTWIINFMIHNLLPTTDEVWLTYDVDVLPATAPVREVRPVWLDVQNGDLYPVFDAVRGDGAGGRFTYPDDVPGAYGDGPPRNEWVVDRTGVLVTTAGHLHPGGLHTDLSLARPGQAAPAPLFRSEAVYYEPAGAVSWDVSMTATRADWRVAVLPGDRLRVSATYDTSRASWYESMGIMVVYLAEGAGGADPFVTPANQRGEVTHGPLPENRFHGGEPTSLPDARTLRGEAAGPPVPIRDFLYGQGDTSESATAVPVVEPGQSLAFVNEDAPLAKGIWHTITACAAPCNRATGIAYPLADADVPFDSGELGTGGPPTADRVTWSTPTDLPEGTYTYFCRIHPFMRGAFRVGETP